MSNVVDAISAEYANEQPVEKEITTPEIQETEPEVEPKEPETEDSGEQQEATETDEPFPKKAKNAITRLKQSNARKNAEIRYLQAKVAEFDKLKTSAAPKEDQFSDWNEFQDAKIEHQVKVSTTKEQIGDAEARLQNYEAEEEAARISEVNEIGENFEREHPAAAKLIADNLAKIAALPDHIKKSLQLADNPPLALHNLIADGKLEYLSQLPPERAAMEIGKADARQIQPKPQTKAPAPMQAARANVNPGFNWQSMSADELLKTIRKG